MPPPTTQDPFGGGAGPFSSFLDPTQTVQPIQWSSGRQPSGYEHAAGGIAFLGTKLLEGITKGRVAAFAKKEQEKIQTFGRLTAMMEAIRTNPGIDPQLKADLTKQYAVMLGKVGSSQIKDSGATKDKGPRGQIAGAIGSVFDKMAGGPFRGDPLTVDDMSKFLGTATKALGSSDSSASSAYDKQQAAINQGMQKARQLAQQDDRQTVTVNDVERVPEIQQALRWYQQYAPDQFKAVQGQFASLPQLGTKEFAQAEYSARLLKQQQPAAGTPPQARNGQQGYLGTIYGDGQSAAPPDTRSVARLGDTSVIRNPPRTGPPEVSEQEPQDREVMEGLRELAGIGPKPEANDVVAYDPRTGRPLFTGTAKQVKSFYDSQNLNLGNRRVDDSEKNRDEKKKEFWSKFKEQTSESMRRLSQADRRIAQNDMALGLRGAEYQLREDEFDEKKAPQLAMSKVIREAAKRGIPFNEFADRAGEVVDAIDDPDVAAHKAYILQEVSKVKQRSNGGGWGSLVPQPPGGKPAPGAAPPASRPQPKPDVSKYVADIKSKLKLDLGDDTPAPAKPSNANPY